MRACRGCGIAFSPEKRSQRYHDPRCQLRHQRLREAMQKKSLRNGFPTQAAIDFGQLIQVYRRDGPLQIRWGKHVYLFTVMP
jgi:hypothetical protein